MIFSFEYDSDYDPPIPIVAIGISKGTKQEREKSLLALIDTGADATVIPHFILSELRTRSVQARKAITPFGGSYLVETFWVAIYIETLRVPAFDAGADPQGNEVILGRDVLNQLILTLNGPALITQIQE